MPFLQFDENRYVSLDEIADIEYTPASSQRLPSFPKLVPGPTTVDVQNPSSLSIRLKGAERITFQGAQADAVWEGFQKAMRPDPE